ncbi:auxin response factor [Striga asiatica]|uniref:Auxin response factor n=1 Tax=Striga asiatica TaxID=4170 RepID=A0A5A7RCI2_STRAF|nr:auxin response factor [Striga asiatica]
MRLSSSSSSPGFNAETEEGEKKCLNSELWHACAGPLVSLPQIGSRVVYFPQGHSEQVAASTNKEVDATIPNYPGLQPQLICQLHNVTMHDYSQTPPCQELLAKDLHGNEWKFRHIFRGQPKRHLLTTGWSVFVSAKRLVAGDSVIFIWNENNQLFLGIRRANRPQTVMPSSVLSSDSMHIGLLAAAAHAAATNSRFTIFYNPRASPSEFVIPLVKYAKAVYHTRVSVGMRFRMLFETEESSVRRYMGTITGISDLDPVRWPNSHWRSVKVGWDESTAGERQPRVSLWEIEPLTTFPMYPSPFSLRLKRPWPAGLPSFSGLKDGDMGMNSPLSFLRGGFVDQGLQSLNFQNLGFSPFMQPRFDSSFHSVQPDNIYQVMAAAALQDTSTSLDPSKLLQFQQNIPNIPTSLMLSQMLQQPPQSHQTFTHNIPENNIISQGQFLQQQQFQLHQPPVIDQQQQIYPQFQDKQVKKSNPDSSPLEPVSEAQFTSQLQNFSDLIRAHIPSSSNNPSMQNLVSSFSREEASQLVSQSSSSKRVALDPQIPNKASHFGVPHLEELKMSNSKVSDISAILPPFPGREYSDFRGPSNSHSNLLFGIGNDSSANVVNGGYESESLTIPYAGPDFGGGVAAEFPLNSDMTTSSCVDESGYLQHSENLDQTNPTAGAFVKVHKSGSFGRSLDISKFSSYPELRCELARMFGLEGLLEDPQRSGWQLVFVDRENDVLLLGDDPWQEFVNSVWYIKILSPMEVQQMRKEGLDLPNSSQTKPVLEQQQ